MRGGGKLGHVPALDGLRGIAILAVLLYHGGYAKGGFVGVDLFFVLSGFLITSLLLEEHAANGRISLRAFYLRRARRLLPVAVAGVLFGELLLVGVAQASHQWRPVLAGPFALFYVENFAHFLHPPVVAQLGHYWSLSEEEQFYFLWPVMVIWLLRRKISLRLLATILFAGATAVMVHRSLLSDPWRLYGPDARADGLLLGCAVAVTWKTGRLRLPAWLAPVSLAVFCADVFIAQHGATTYGVTVATLSAAAAIGSLIANPDAIAGRFLSNRWLCWVGLISYSLYIWQPLVASTTGATGVPMLVASALAGLLSYRFIEQPFRRRPQLKGKIPEASAASA